MNFESWPEKLSEALLKNPRAAFSFGAVAVIVFLASTILGLVAFIRSQNATTLDNNAAEITEQKAKVTNLELKYDSLVNLVGAVRLEGARKEVELKDSHNATLTALNGNQKETIAAMERELQTLRAASNKTRRLSETVKNNFDK